MAESFRRSAEVHLGSVREATFHRKGAFAKEGGFLLKAES
jgi:hypothetical protein